MTFAKPRRDGRMLDGVMVTGRAGVPVSPPARTPAPCEAPTRSRNPALSACMREMLLCNSHFSLSRCAPLIILFDLTPKRQVMTNKGPELRATVVNNNTSVPHLTPRSFWAGITRDGSSCISEKLQLLDGAFFTSPSLSLSAAFQPLNHQ